MANRMGNERALEEVWIEAHSADKMVEVHTGFSQRCIRGWESGRGQ